MGRCSGIGGWHRGCVVADSVSTQSAKIFFFPKFNSEEAALIASCYIEVHALTSCTVALSGRGRYYGYVALDIHLIAYHELRRLLTKECVDLALLHQFLQSSLLVCNTELSVPTVCSICM